MAYQPVSTSLPPESSTPSFQITSQGPRPDQQITLSQPQPIAPTSSFAPAPLPSQDPRLYNPAAALSPSEDTSARGIDYARSTAEASLREFLIQQDKRRFGDQTSEERFRAQRAMVLSDLERLRRDVSAVIREAESHRVRRWLLGGFVGSVIPAIKRILRRTSASSSSKDSVSQANRTEYAFGRSKALVSRILRSVKGKGWFATGFASVALFVLAVLYVFQAEVELRVAKTVNKRLKRLVGRLERGNEGLGDKDLQVFKGWRWRIMLWGR